MVADVYNRDGGGFASVAAELPRVGHQRRLESALGDLHHALVGGRDSVRVRPYLLESLGDDSAAVGVASG